MPPAKLTVFLTSLAVILFALIANADIEQQYEVLRQILSEHRVVEPQVINALPASSTGQVAYVTHVKWIGNATAARIVTDPFLTAYLRAYSISYNTQLNLTDNFLIPDKISGLLYKVEGLPLFSFNYRILDYSFENILSGLELPNPVVSLYHRFNNTYRFLTAVVYITPLLSSNNTLSSLSIKLEWWSGWYNETSGDTVIQDLSSVFISSDYNTFRSRGLRLYLLPTFNSYVDPADGNRYMVFGFSYKVEIPNTNSTTGAFAWETVRLYNVSEPNFDVFQRAVHSVYGWTLWIGEGVYYYRDTMPILHILPSYAIFYTEIKAMIENPVVYTLSVDEKKLYDLVVNDTLGYYRPPPEFVSLYMSNRENNTVSIDVAIVVFLALGAGLGFAMLLPRYRFAGLVVFGFIVYAYSPDPRIVIITILSGVAAALDMWRWE